MIKKAKIIDIMSHPSAFELYSNVPRPEINLNTSDGQCVCIRRADWADFIGKEILKLTDEFEY